MMRKHPHLLTLLLAHVAGSYCGYFPTILWMILDPKLLIPDVWIYITLAPVCMPIYLVLTTIADIPHYGSPLMQAWACYVGGFAIMCLIRHKKTPIRRLAITPIIPGLFVATLWSVVGPLPPFPADVGSIPVGKPAPDFTLTTLAGTTCSISREKGHVILIDFWGSTCPPCRKELKEIIANLASDSALRERGLLVWTIDFVDDAETARKFVDNNHYAFVVMLDPNKLASGLYRPSLPGTFLIGRDGMIKESIDGYDSKSDQRLRMAIDAAIK